MHKLDAGELKIIHPEVTFDSRFTIHMGGKTAELMYWGAGQNPGDTLIHFPHARVLFVGGHGDVSKRQDVLDSAQMHEDFLKAMKDGMARGLDRDQLANTIRMEKYQHYRNYSRIRGWVYALHHLLSTGKPMAPLN